MEINRMSEPLTIAAIDRIKGRVHAFIADHRKRMKGCHCLDVRIEASESKGGYAQDGTAKESLEDAEPSMGIRVHAGKSMIAPGYFGKTFRQFAHDLAQDTIDLAGADRLEAMPVAATVVTDPHYNALLVREIVGDSYLIADGKLAQPLKPHTVCIDDIFILLFQQIIGGHTRHEPRPRLVGGGDRRGPGTGCSSRPRRKHR
jgi:hypothetical protein